MSEAVRSIVIVGGGSAGWLVACVLAASHDTASPAGLQITLLEAPGIPPIGVGEGTWPSMRDTLHGIGLPEADLFTHCDASFKQGSLFKGWLTGAAGDQYAHPFVVPQGYGEADLVNAWLQSHGHVPFAELVSYQPRVCTQGLAPKQRSTPQYAAVANYGYHFDAGKFGLRLRQHAVEKLGVRHVLGEVVGVNSAENGDIASLQTLRNGALAGDLFIDCTGLPSLLLGQHFGIPVVSQRHVLFNDRALALQVPYPHADSPIATQTIATAQANGWVWDIGLPTRRGVGHVYSSAHTSDEAAEQTLRQHIQATDGPGDLPAARKLRFEPGYRAEFWHRNCVAIGLSAGFIEPLEASALALVELSVHALSAQMPATRAAMPAVARHFNEAFRYRWERVIDFLKLHYALTQRTDTPYWRDHARPESLPDRLRELLAQWQHRPPSHYDFPRIEEVFPSASYQYVLYGMRFQPKPTSTRRPQDPAQAEQYFREAATLATRMGAALPRQRELIQHIQQHGMPRI
jgi:tryptophan 7-halogenase